MLVLPGYLAGDGSTYVMRRFLRSLGYAAHGWGLGRNHGNVARLMPGVLARLESLGEPACVVGWSLGGVIARELARQAPERVRRVVTLGTPVVGGARYTAFGATYARRGADLEAIAAKADAREAVPIPAPVVALFSKADRVVAWQATQDPSARVRHVEVPGSHAELGFRAAALVQVAQALRAHD